MLNETNEIRETRSATIPWMDLINRGLPHVCVSYHPSSGGIVALKLGSMGYWPISIAELGYEEGVTVDHINEQMGVDAAQRQAMEAGAMFGFHVPGAFPEYYRKKS